MKISGRAGRLRMRLDPVEVQLLRSLFDQLEAVLEEEDGADEVHRRLFPAAYPDDERAEADYRVLTQPELRGVRDERLAACRADLEQGGDVDLADPDVARRWLQVLNDLRLALGTRIGVTEEDDHTVDRAAPDAEARSVYYWLTAVQDSLVTAVMR